MSLLFGHPVCHGAKITIKKFKLCVCVGKDLLDLNVCLYHVFIVFLLFM